MKTCQLVSLKEAQLPNGDILALPCTVNYYYIISNEQAKEAVDILQSKMSDPKSTFAIDIETNGLDPFIDDIVLLQIGTSENIQYMIDMRKVDKEVIKNLFSSSCWKLGHNIKFDAKFIKHKFGVNIKKFYSSITNFKYYI